MNNARVALPLDGVAIEQSTVHGPFSLSVPSPLAKSRAGCPPTPSAGEHPQLGDRGAAGTEPGAEGGHRWSSKEVR